jgi:hypothetical protein
MDIKHKASWKMWLEQSKQLPLREDLRCDLIEWVKLRYEVALPVAKEVVYSRTSDDLWKRIKPFTHGTNDEDSHISHNPWPFVELVRYVSICPTTVVAACHIEPTKPTHCWLFRYASVVIRRLASRTLATPLVV